MLPHPPSGVELHHELLGSFWAVALGAPLLPGGTPLLKLHGDMPQAERTQSFLRFNEVREGLVDLIKVHARQFCTCPFPTMPCG